MNVKEAAKKWNVSESTVKNYCQDGMLPFAYKEGRKWLIPDEAEKPLLTRHKAVIYMAYILVYNDGGNPNLEKVGSKWNESIEAYTYLVDVGFISKLSNGKTLAEKLKNVNITVLGKGLIEGELADEKIGKIKINAGLKIRLLKFLEAEIGFEKEF